MATDAVVTSNSVSVSGINGPAPISVAGGEYSIDGGPFTSAPGTILNGQSLRVRLTAASAFGTSKTATVTVGDVSASFTGTTADEVPSADVTPDPFSFTAYTDMAVKTDVTSNTITVSGINAPAAISVLDGEYSINDGPFTSEPGTVLDGGSVVIRLTTSPAFSTTVSAVLTIGGVSAEFSATTMAEPYVPEAKPNAFGFTPRTDVAPGAEATSDAVSVNGIDAPVAISIDGGEYSIDDGPFTAAPGTVVAGQTVRVWRHASSDFATTATVALTIGGVIGVFTVTTIGADTTPDAFSFAPQLDVALDALTASDAIVVTGINTGAAVSVVGGEYSVNGSGYTSASGSVQAGDVVTVRVTSSSSYSTAVSATLAIGGVAASFTVTTLADPGPDRTPHAFTFGVRTGVNPHTTQSSDSVVISGIAAAGVTVQFPETSPLPERPS